MPPAIHIRTPPGETLVPIESPLYQFTILVSTALVFQIVSRRLYLPAMTGLLVLGMLLGPGGLGVLPDREVIELLGMKHILGAFLAGVCLNESTRRHPELREHIEFAGTRLAAEELPKKEATA